MDHRMMQGVFGQGPRVGCGDDMRNVAVAPAQPPPTILESVLTAASEHLDRLGHLESRLYDMLARMRGSFPSCNGADTVDPAPDGLLTRLAYRLGDCKATEERIAGLVRELESIV